MNDLFIPVDTRSETHKVYLYEINYIERRGRQIILKKVDGQITYNGSIDHISRILDDRFYMCHRSLIVNLEHINSAKNQILEFINGDSKFIGIHNFRQTRRAYKQHLEDIFLHRKRTSDIKYKYH